MKSNVTNVQVANDLGVDHSTVSRVRSGKMTPGMRFMVKAEEYLGYDLSLQAKHVRQGKYAGVFEQALMSSYNRWGTTPPLGRSCICDDLDYLHPDCPTHGEDT